MFQNIWYQAGRLIVWVYIHVIMRVDIHQEQPFPRGAKILAVNHPSTNDPAFVTALSGEHMTILIKETVFKVPLFGWSVRKSGHIPVIAGQGKAAMDEALALLRAGRTVVVFPEGEISPERGFHRPHTGVARLALATGAPVIPIGISLDCQRVHVVRKVIDGELEPISWYLRGPYAITVGDPVRFTGDLENYEEVRAVTAQVMQRIVALTLHGHMRLRAAQAPRLSTASPKTTMQVAWKGAWQGFQQSGQLITRTGVFRIAESAFVFLMMYARHLVG